ncbi:NAD(P)/FAD-dependent oxidoreductase [Streptomyces lonarensis]|uniref:NAD(P)/FAD-dependent oxidoreductase n=1 Tax=Streptomyces lonarensis TaxID=700599 RepID=UPI0028B18CA6|nr:FAD-dependent oxidoreductase [Streptomyces lonarensis]
MNSERVVIVGAGLAGAHTASHLRQAGWQGEIDLLGAEPHRPYDRPPLSKELLSGEAADAWLETDLDALDVRLRTGVAATGLDPAARLLATDAGPVGWDHLVIATGAAPRTLPGAAHTPGVHLLRTLDDALSLRAALVPGARLVVVGAGWIGAEVTSTARAAGCEVVVVEAAGAPLPGVLPAEAAESMRRWYREAGARLLTGSPVTEVRPDGVRLADGGREPADAVLVAVGSRPDTGWLEGSGLPLADDGSILADARLRAGAPGVYAVGDCASFPSARYGRRLLVQHWDNALQGPATVAAAIAGGEPAPYDPVPYFWSRQFGRMVQSVGLHAPGDQLLRRGSPEDEDGWTLCWTGPDGALTAVLAVDRPRDLAQGRRLVERRAAVDPAALRDPAVPLKRAAR